MDADVFYSYFNPGAFYYIVEDKDATKNIPVDHYITAIDGRIYVATNVEINVEGIARFDAPEYVEPVEEVPDDSEEIVDSQEFEDPEPGSEG